MTGPSLGTRELGPPTADTRGIPGLLVVLVATILSVVGGVLLIFGTEQLWALIVAVVAVILGLFLIVEDVLRYLDIGQVRAAKPRHRRLIEFILATIGVGLTSAGLAAILVDRGNDDVRLTGTEQRGRRLFVSNCSNCHTLRATASAGMVGPDLDAWTPWGIPAGVVRDAIERGREGEMAHMPSGLLDGADGEAVAAFVAKVTAIESRRRGGPPSLTWKPANGR